MVNELIILVENCIFALFSELEIEQKLDIAVPSVTMTFDVKGEGKQVKIYLTDVHHRRFKTPHLI